jgi:hypothetical protein
MNSKFSAIASLLLILVGIMIWSVSILAADPHIQEDIAAAADSTASHHLVSSADTANQEAVKDAARSIREAIRLDLDIRLVGPTSVQLAAK